MDVVEVDEAAGEWSVTGVFFVTSWDPRLVRRISTETSSYNGGGPNVRRLAIVVQ